MGVAFVRVVRVRKGCDLCGGGEGEKSEGVTFVRVVRVRKVRV